MKVLVVGAGLLGLSSAYALRRAGLEVEIFEAHEELGNDAGYANGGLLTAAMADPWNAPGIVWQLLRSLPDPQAAMKLRLSVLPSLFGWGRRFAAHANERDYRQAISDNYRLASYSIGLMKHVRLEADLTHEVGKGSIKLFRSRHAMARPLEIASGLQSFGLRYEVLDAARTVQLEPELQAIRNEIAGAIYFPDDEHSDARDYCSALARFLEASGCRIESGAEVRRILIDRNGAFGVATDDGARNADSIVIAAGSRTPGLLSGTGVSVPIVPVKGYSLTVPLDDPDVAPRTAIVDDQLHAAVTPLGGCLRVAGTAEFAGFDTSVRADRIENLHRLLRAIYPNLAEDESRERRLGWAGLRPMSADGRPFVGATQIQGLFVNSGHGHLGWTMAMGSAQLLADLITGQSSAIDPKPYSPLRFN